MGWGSDELEDVKLFFEKTLEFGLEEGVVVTVNFVLPGDEEIVDIIRPIDGLFQCRFKNRFEVFFLPEVPDRDDDIAAWLGDAREFGYGFFPELMRRDVMKGSDRKRRVDRVVGNGDIQETSEHKMVVGKEDFCLFNELLAHVNAGIGHVEFKLTDESAISTPDICNGCLRLDVGLEELKLLPGMLAGHREIFGNFVVIQLHFL